MIGTELKCILTFSNGLKEKVIVCLKNKPIFIKQLE